MNSNTTSSGVSWYASYSTDGRERFIVPSVTIRYYNKISTEKWVMNMP